VQGELFVLFELWIGGLCSLLGHGFALCLSLSFDCLLRFLFIRFFSFCFVFGYKSRVLSMHSSRGRLRTMCVSRTGGWSLPGVMSD
jgi:hypothetical protein